jgi:hypothetical protein
MINFSLNQKDLQTISTKLINSKYFVVNDAGILINIDEDNSISIDNKVTNVSISNINYKCKNITISLEKFNLNSESITASLNIL